MYLFEEKVNGKVKIVISKVVETKNVETNLEKNEKQEMLDMFMRIHRRIKISNK